MKSVRWEPDPATRRACQVFGPVGCCGGGETAWATRLSLPEMGHRDVG